MNRVVHFEILTENPEKLSKFYSNVFGWKFEKWDDRARLDENLNRFYIQINHVL